MNEEALVDFLRRNFSFRTGVGIGDDASAVPQGKTHQLITTDLLVENVHFRLEDISLEALAQKSLAVNISDIAAMGGVPLYFYLGLAFPLHLGEERLRRFFRGLKQGARKWGVELAGGDFSHSDRLTIAITLVGSSQRPVFRSGARTGDWIGITGPPGGSALGLKLLQQGTPDRRFVRRHIRVEPEVAKGKLLARHASAMIDISDGLLLDLKRILRASRRGAELDADKIPVAPGMERVCRRYGWKILDLLLGGGEDYLLLFTISPEEEKKARKKGIGYTLIGRVRERSGMRVLYQGRPIRIESMGFDHFQNQNKGRYS